MEKILLELMKRHYVKYIDSHRFGVIASYVEQLRDIAKEFDVDLLEWNPSASKLTVWGEFRLK